jgi:hypothetical protein
MSVLGRIFTRVLGRIFTWVLGKVVLIRIFNQGFQRDSWKDLHFVLRRVPGRISLRFSEFSLGFLDRFLEGDLCHRHHPYPCPCPCRLSMLRINVASSRRHHLAQSSSLPSSPPPVNVNLNVASSRRHRLAQLSLSSSSLPPVDIEVNVASSRRHLVQWLSSSLSLSSSLPLVDIDVASYCRRCLARSSSSLSSSQLPVNIMH